MTDGERPGDSRDVSDGRSDSPHHPDTVPQTDEDDGRGGEGGPDGDSGYADAADEADPEGDTPEEAQVSTAERAVMVIALAVTAGLFAFAAWQAFVGASAANPAAGVTGERDIGEDESYYAVTLRNDGDAGLVSATVSVACPDPRRRVTFENVPANAHRNATVSCPDGSTPSADVVSWVPA